MEKTSENNPGSSENYFSALVVDNNFNRAPSDFFESIDQEIAILAQDCDQKSKMEKTPENNLGNSENYFFAFVVDNNFNQAPNFFESIDQELAELVQDCDQKYRMEKTPENNPGSSENYLSSPVTNNNFNQTHPEFFERIDQEFAKLVQNCDRECRMEKKPENNPGSSENNLSTPVANNKFNQAPLEFFEGIDQESAKLVQYCDESYLDEFPIGYRFVPTDEELVSIYLLPKIRKEILPTNRIHEVDVYKHSPYELTEKYRAQGEKEWYFFTTRERRCPNGKRPKRATKEGNEPTGYWKATGSAKAVFEGGVHVGSRQALVYYKGKASNGQKQPWTMQEFVAIRESIPANGTEMKLDECVLCKIYKNSDRRSGDNEGNNGQSHAPAQQVMVDDGAQQEF